jgi:hypothetical protein
LANGRTKFGIIVIVVVVVAVGIIRVVKMTRGEHVLKVLTGYWLWLWLWLSSSSSSSPVDIFS